MDRISKTDLILNENGSIYHLHLKPGELAKTIITVGDPGRVSMVSKYFDETFLHSQHREFITITGRIGDTAISVISTGIGTDNIDICLNEIDALFNIDLENRRVKKDLTKLNFIRLGTSGCIQANIPVDVALLSSHAFELEGILAGYDYQENIEESQISAELKAIFPISHYLNTVSCDAELFNLLAPEFLTGISYTAGGFYGPQARQLRLRSRIQADTLKLLSELQIAERRVCNIEMESAVLFGLAKLLGHCAISVNTLLANRTRKAFSKNGKKAVDQMIYKVLDILTSESAQLIIN